MYSVRIILLVLKEMINHNNRKMIIRKIKILIYDCIEKKKKKREKN